MQDEGLSALFMRVGELSEGQRAIYQRQRIMDKRLTELERRKDGSRLAGLIREVATPREWCAILLVVLGAIWGIVTPEDVRDKVRSFLDLPPLSRLERGS